MAIFLIGYMACGKTTLGQALAEAGFAPFVDLDQEIERRSGLSPAQWFDSRGEAAFRAAEMEVLREIAAENPRAVIAAGGGTPCNPSAMDLMLGAGTVVWLEASLERTVDRLLEADGKRPLVASMSRAELVEFIPGHLESRIPHYRRAHIRFDSSLLDNEDELSRTVARFISLFNNRLPAGRSDR